MKRSYPLLLLAMIATCMSLVGWMGCDSLQSGTVEPTDTSLKAWPESSQKILQLAITAGDRVETVDDTPVYERASENSTILNTLQAGELGTVTSGPRTRGNLTWFLVDFDSGLTGYVTDDHIVLVDDDGGDPPPPPPPPPTGEIMVGLAGCSLERETNDGLKYVGTETEDGWSWPRDATTYFSGGHLDNWANPNDGIWEDWSAAYASYGATVIHVMPCIRGPESGKSKARSEDVPWPIDEEAQQMRDWLDNLEAHAPGVPVYISGQPDYLENHCETTGVHGPAAMDSLAKVMVAEGRALLGPTIGPLVNLPQGTPGDETRPLDECHPNLDGAVKIGNQFRDWIAGLIEADA